jgi:NADPH-dependent curcumin reductase CurA
MSTQAASLAGPIPMPQSTLVNRRIVLRSRPVGAPTSDNFHVELLPVPEPSDGQVLLRALCLSLDPCMRGRMSEAPSYAAPLAIGDTMVGSKVSIVQSSRRPDFSRGERVLGYCGWQDYALSDGTGLSTLLRKRIRMQGFIVFADYGPRFSEFAGVMGTWVEEGKVKFREDIVHGLENAPEAFLGLLEGRNFGKLVICVAND